MPARVSLATGLYPHNLNLWDNTDFCLPSDWPTWMRSVRAAGFRTALIGKTHLYSHLESSVPFDMRHRTHLVRSYGFDFVDEIPGPKAAATIGSSYSSFLEDQRLLRAYQKDIANRQENKPYVARPSPVGEWAHPDAYVGRRAFDYLAHTANEEPWFCCVSFGGPHEPWDAPGAYASMYQPGDMPLPLPDPSWSEVGQYDGHLRETFASAKSHPMFETGEVAALRANYAGKVSLIDSQIGRILELLREKGVYENTAVIVCSDHGEMNGDYGLLYKRTFYDAAVRVPLVFRIPEIPRPKLHRIADPVEWIDIGPTIAELAGADIAYRQFGRSLLPLMTDNSSTSRDSVLSECAGEIMIMTRQWKMVLNAAGQPYLLFSRAEHGSEARNLMNSPKTVDVISELRRAAALKLLESQAVGPTSAPTGG
jgi:choline-sulfatase